MHFVVAEYEFGHWVDIVEHKSESPEHLRKTIIVDNGSLSEDNMALAGFHFLRRRHEQGCDPTVTTADAI